MRYFPPLILLFVSVSLFGAAHKSTQPPEGARPNILYIYVDDMGWGSLGPNGQFERKAEGLPHLVTPTLDRLAAEGVNFRRSYGCTVCSPARSSQQTGFHQGHTYADQNNPDNAMKAIRSEDITMGDVLSKAGYVTGYWGKWGYGGSKSQPDPEILNVQTLPTSHGYEHVVAELHHVRAHTFYQPTLWKAPATPGSVGGLELIPNSMDRWAGTSAYPDTPALQSHPDYPDTAYCDDVYAFAALDFVRIQSQNYNATGQPFFGLLAVQVPHAPFAEVSDLPEWSSAYDQLSFFSEIPEQAQHWAAMISRIDGHIGNILASLDDPNGDGNTADSVVESTLIIFQSDNGGPQHPAREVFDANGGLREVKGRIEDGGIRVPMMIRLPAKFASQSLLKAGMNSEILLDVTDLLPTFADLAGVKAPLGIDGVSIAPALLGKGEQRTREFLIHEAGNGQSIIRGDYKLIRRKQGFELYNLRADPSESSDMAGKYPELVKELEALMLGERVAEPQGFANTYHCWTGGNAALVSDADNWSDYQYSNAGITYMTDSGSPQLSWTAVMENVGNADSLAVANKDVEFLALEIRGESAVQSLVLDPYIKLTGRNEIRISKYGSLTVNQGLVSSLRWINVETGGVLKGNGTVEGIVYNSGEVSAMGKLVVTGDYHQADVAVLNAMLEGKATVLDVAGDVNLAGELKLNLAPKFKPKKGQSYSLISAQNVSGAFSNLRDQVSLEDGTSLTISYSQNQVTLVVN